MNTEQNEEQQTEGTPLVGDVLRQAREKLGYSQKNVANRLRLRISVIDDIENNCFDKPELATFTRGYVRSYAKCVGLDEAVVMQLLDDCGHIKPTAQNMQSFSRRTKREAHDSRIMGLTWILAAIFVGVTAVWWWQNIHLEQNPAVPINKSEIAPAVSTSSKVSTLVVKDNNNPADDNDSGVATSIQNDDTTNNAKAALSTDNAVTSGDVATATEPEVSIKPTNTTDAQNVPLAQSNVSTAVNKPADQKTPVTPVDSTEQTSKPTKEADVAVTTPALQLAFSADCWVDIRDANGKRLVSGIQKPGQKLALNGKAPFRVRLGAPSAVKIDVNGQPFDLSQYPATKPVTLKLQ